MTGEATQRLIRALALDGFTPRVRADGLTFRGSVAIRNRRVPLRLDFDGFEFAAPPTVVVEDAALVADRVLPHIDEDGTLCAVDPRLYLADRYHAAEQARGIVRRAAEVLALGLTVEAVKEIAAEFPRHWGGLLVPVEFGPFDGFAEPYTDAQGKVRLRRAAGPILPPETGAAVAQTDVHLSFRLGDRRPATLGAVLAWADQWDLTLRTKILDGLAALGPSDPYVMIHAPNGVVGFQLMVSNRGVRQITAITRPSAWARLLHGTFGSNLDVQRLQGLRVDEEYVFGTNSIDGVAPLAGRKVVLVGCGAIGGHLAFSLAQLGAGLGSGSLALIDSEKLADRNAARHRLGLDRVGSYKASGTKDALNQAFPRLSIQCHDRKVEQCRGEVLGADVVIDATGEQGVSEMLNAWMLEQRRAGIDGPALLHTWIEGNGAAAQSFYSTDPDFGCYRCLHPDHLKAPRFPVLRAEVVPITATGCGEAVFSPYGPAAPLAAAALAAHHVADWARGAARPLLRTLRLSYAETQERKPTNPTRSADCPACAPRP